MRGEGEGGVEARGEGEGGVEVRGEGEGGVWRCEAVTYFSSTASLSPTVFTGQRSAPL